MVINDFRLPDGSWARGYTIDGVQYITKASSMWSSMRQRCRIGGPYQTKNKTYIGCTVGESFAKFQDFAGWYTTQVGYGLKGYHLDKDFLVRGNKEYGTATCVLIPTELNSFLCNAAAQRGDCPIGVTRHSDGKKFTAQIKVGGKLKYLGVFDCTEEANSAYVLAKESEARRWASRLLMGEFDIDQRVIDVLMTWRCPES